MIRQVKISYKGDGVSKGPNMRYYQEGTGACQGSCHFRTIQATSLCFPFDSSPTDLFVGIIDTSDTGSQSLHLPLIHRPGVVLRCSHLQLRAVYLKARCVRHCELVVE